MLEYQTSLSSLSTDSYLLLLQGTILAKHSFLHVLWTGQYGQGLPCLLAGWLTGQCGRSLVCFAYSATVQAAFNCCMKTCYISDLFWIFSLWLFQYDICSVFKWRHEAVFPERPLSWLPYFLMFVSGIHTVLSSSTDALASLMSIWWLWSFVGMF